MTTYKFPRTGESKNYIKYELPIYPGGSDMPGGTIYVPRDEADGLTSVDVTIPRPGRDLVGAAEGGRRATDKKEGHE